MSPKDFFALNPSVCAKKGDKIPVGTKFCVSSGAHPYIPCGGHTAVCSRSAGRFQLGQAVSHVCVVPLGQVPE